MTSVIPGELHQHKYIPFYTSRHLFSHHTPPWDFNSTDTLFMYWVPLECHKPMHSLSKYLRFLCPWLHKESALTALGVTWPPFHGRVLRDTRSMLTSKVSSGRALQILDPHIWMWFLWTNITVQTTAHAGETAENPAPILTSRSFTKTNPQTQAKILIIYFFFFYHF